MKFEIMDTANGEVLPTSADDAVKAMNRLESLRRQRAFLIERLGVFRDACVTLRVRKQRTEARLNAELLEARRDSDRALRLAEKDNQSLLDTIERLKKENEQAKSDVWFAMLWEENQNLGDEITRLQELYESAEEENKRLNAELDAERVETAKWRDIAERCFASAMKNAVALADERKGERGE